MKIITVGINYKTAPIDIREKIAFDPDETAQALAYLKSAYPDSQFVLLSTCNRVEIYCASRNNILNTLINFLSEFHKVPLEVFRDYLYVHKDIEAVKHLLTVAAGLDSMVVGESQIFAQVKESYKIACKAKATGKILNRLFHCSFATAKKIHTHTSISYGRVSVAGAAVDLAKRIFPAPSSPKVLVIGAGEMGNLLVKHLLHIKYKNITVVNRSYDNGVKMAANYGVDVRKWRELPELFNDADIVIASTSSHQYLFTKTDMDKIISRRHKDSLLIIDVAVPRNFEPFAKDIKGVYLYCIDELSDIAEKNRQLHEYDITKGLQIIMKKAADFMDWFRVKDIGPLVGEMKVIFDKIGQRQVKNFFTAAIENEPYRDSVELMMRQSVDRIFHCVIKEIKSLAKERNPVEVMEFVNGIVQNAKDTLNQDEKENAADDKYQQTIL